MKVKLLFTALAVLGISGIITAQQGNVELLDDTCPCCENSKNTVCYEVFETGVYACGTGYNTCDVAPPPEGI